MKAMLLAAGRGTRMRPLSNNIPKPLLMVGKQRLIEYHFLALAKIGITEIIINVAYKAEQIMDTLGDGKNYGVTIKYSVEEKSLDTGGGIYNALPLLGKDPFLVINSDLYTDYPYQNLLSQPKKLAHLVLVDNPQHHQNGDFALQENLVTLAEPKLTFAGIGVYTPELFTKCNPGKFSLAPLLVSAIKNEQVTGEHYQGQWANIGTPEQLVYYSGDEAKTT